MNHFLVSINILSYNDKSFIKKAIASAVQQSYPCIEILIIDNASPGQSGKIVEKEIGNWKKQREDLLKELYSDKNYPVEIRLIKNSENRGFAAGHNQAIRECSGDFILCLNSDAILEKNYVEQALKCFNGSKVGAVQGKILRYDFRKNEVKKDSASGKNIIDTVGLVMLKNRRVIAKAQGELDKGQYEKEEEIFGPDGAVPIYRRKALEDVKLPPFNPSFRKGKKNEIGEYFDNDFFIYKEDVDLAWRLRLYGWKMIYQPKAVAYHGRGAGDSAETSYSEIIKERRKISQFAKYYSFKNQRLMQIKNEISILFLRHLPQFLFKEIASWIYVIIFEHYTVKAIKELFRQMPGAFRKRRIIMRRKKVGTREMKKWFI